MRRYSPAVRVWVVMVGLLALARTIAAALEYSAAATDWVTLAGLALGAAIAHGFPIRAARDNATYQTTGIFVVAGAVLLPPELLGPLVLVALTPPIWAARRQPGVAMHWTFNVAQTVVAAQVASAWVRAMGAHGVATGRDLVVLLAAALLFALVQAALVGVMIALHARRPLLRVGTFTPPALLGDGLIALLGLLLASMWLTNPLLVGLALPLLPIAHHLTRTAHLAHLAQVDAKTGLHSVHAFERALEEELARARRLGRPLALLFVDMDHFKAINDRHGHVAGDRVLREAAGLLQATLRKGDILARFGGEEFIALLPGTDIEEAAHVAERLRGAIAAAEFTLDGGAAVRCTVSIGVAACPRHGTDAAALSKQADLAMYRAKRMRNAVVRASAPPAPPAAPSPAASGQAAPADAPDASPMGDERPAEGGAVVPDAERPDPDREAPAAPEPAATVDGAPTAGASGAGSARAEHLDEARLRRLVAAIALAGVGVVGASLPFVSVALAVRLLPLAVLVALAERLTDLEFGRTKISLGSMVAMAAGAIGGPAAGALIGLVNGLATLRRGTLSPIKSPFNVATLTLSAAAAGLPYWAAQRWLGPGELGVGWLPLLLGVLAGLIYFGVNYVPLAAVIALASGTTWLTEWRLRCGWLVLHYAIMGGISVALVMLFVAHGLIGVVLLLGPAAMLYYAQRQYITHTAAHVGELSTLNQELATSNERLTEALAELRHANDAMLTAFSEALELRDRETKGHSQRVVHYSRALAAALDLPPAEVTAVVHGALLHDIGKIGVRDAILHKPGKLTPEEWVEMRRHPEIGHRMIAHIPFLAPASGLVRHHHERWDGGGYPAGLAGEAIPLGARIFAVADTFDAMTSDRPYRAALAREAAVAELERCAGTQFDPAVVAAFIDLVAAGALEQPDLEVKVYATRALEYLVRAVRSSSDLPATPALGGGEAAG